MSLRKSFSDRNRISVSYRIPAKNETLPNEHFNLLLYIYKKKKKLQTHIPIYKDNIWMPTSLQQQQKHNSITIFKIYI